MAGVALGDIHLRFTWQAWHLWHWACSGGALQSQLTPWTPRRFCVAGVALGDIDLHFLWQAWHNWSSHVTSTVTLRGRRGTYGTGLRLLTPWTPRLFCVAGVALADIHLRFTWQVWHLATSAFVSRGRRGTWRHPPSLHVAGVALTALGLLRWRAWVPVDAVDAAAVLRGRRGTW